jgi:hypothetical protein
MLYIFAKKFEVQVARVANGAPNREYFTPAVCD